MSAALAVRQNVPVLLFNDECAVCRRIAHWVIQSAGKGSAVPAIIVRRIGDDPEALRALDPDLDIWDAYETIHLLMPDGSMKLGGEAVAEVLRGLPNTRWFARIFGLRIFQQLLNLAYAILSEVRPLFGCESCGTPGFWTRPIRWFGKHLKAVPANHDDLPHFTPRAAGVGQP
jgi:predicted DCC family thiol-disulfide oxidoreductase YuxK